MSPKRHLRCATFRSACAIAVSTANAQALPARGWPATTPAAVGLDGAALAAFDADLQAASMGLPTACS